MRKFYLLLLVACFSSVCAFAQKSTGFRGYVNAGYVLSCSEIGYADVSNRIAFEAIGGYQITPKFFAGLGVGGQYFHEGDAWTVPVFADARYDFMSNSITPFAEVQFGYSFADWEGLYFNPQVGVRFALNEKLGLNLGVGYLLQTLKYVDGTSGDITFKVGIDF